jgi:CubicO group peptidase (beta-lactamase class C family)
LVAMSASKSLVSLAVGLLIADKRLSLDTRMAAFLPEWGRQGAKGNITVRQLLTHTSGLDPSRADFERGETIREHARKAKLLWPPGTRFQYNNGAVDFLAYVVHQAAGMPLDVFLDERVFRKLDAIGVHWVKDSAGDPRGAGELFIRPVDLAKVGQLMLDGGRWNGEEIVPSEWIARSTAAGQSFDERCGMLWWRLGRFALTVNTAMLAQWRDAGLDAPALASVRKLLGVKYPGYAEYGAALTAVVGADTLTKLTNTRRKGDHVPSSGEVTDGPVTGFAAEGWLGQHLVVYPSSRVVAVRMRAPEGGDYGGEGERNAYQAFAQDVAEVFPGEQPTSDR